MEGLCSSFVPCACVPQIGAYGHVPSLSVSLLAVADDGCATKHSLLLSVTQWQHFVSAPASPMQSQESRVQGSRLRVFESRAVRFTYQGLWNKV